MKSFVPLESNPTVFNAFLAKLGLKGLEFTDVYGLDPELLNFVPRPVYAVLLVFPVSPTYEAYRTEEDAKPLQDTTAVWSQQTIRNSCGTMALIHAISNNVPSDKLGDGFGNDLVTELSTRPQAERPAFLEHSIELEKLHNAVAGGGDTEAPDADADVELHYVTITKNGSDLVELDGRRKGPIVRARDVQSADVLAVPETLTTIQEFIEREKGSSNFAMLALVDAS